MVYKFFDKKTKCSRLSHIVKSTTQSEQLAEELHKFIIRNFKKKRKRVYSALKDNIWGADLADMQWINKSNKGFRFFFVFLLTFLANMHRLFL